MLSQTNFFREHSKNIILIFSFSLIALIFLIANPSYYSHDELQKLDHVNQFGLKDYIFQYVKLKQGDTFGTPVRPLAFLVQGFLAMAMESYPVIVHLSAVLMHATVACLLYLVVIQFGGAKSFALIAALIFSINPLAVIAVGWSAALMDRLYVLFGLLALLSADHYIRGAGKVVMLGLVFFWSSLAMLSKETAIILPGLMIVIILIEPKVTKLKRYWLSLVVWFIPIIIFLLYRLSAIISSFGKPSVSAYEASLTNIPDGLLVYIAYPFSVMLTEAGNWIFIQTHIIQIAVGLHVFLVFILAINYGYKIFIYYWVLYFLFLVPVLLIPIKAAHYLYGSALVLSVCIAALINSCNPLNSVYKLLGALAFFALAVHSLVIQEMVYSIGKCMSRAITSTEALHASHDFPNTVTFQADPGAPEHILYRLYTGRNHIGQKFPIDITITKLGEPSPPDTITFRMDESCLVYEKEF